jgi:23S rRNA (cytosine1962-C5)-methyltransferase
MSQTDRLARTYFIVLNPPSLARLDMEREGAIRSHERLNLQDIGKLGRDGILVAASCFAHVSCGERR